MFSPENSTKYLKNTKTSQTLPKSRKEGNGPASFGEASITQILK